MMKDMKGQEEILGFVAVVVVVAVVFIVVVGLTLNAPVQETPHKDLQTFLESVGKVTTACRLAGVPADVKHVLAACADGKSCDQGKSCDAARETLSGIFNVSFRRIEGRTVKGYTFKAEYESGTKGKKVIEEIVEITKGNCSGSTRSASTLFDHAPGNIRTSLQICS